MSRKREAEPLIEPKRFDSLDEIDRAIAKLNRRISEVTELQTNHANHNAPDRKTATENIRNDILKIYGSTSPEYDKHRFHTIEHGTRRMNASDQENQSLFEAGIPHTLGLLHGLVKSLGEERLDIAPGQRERQVVTNSAVFIGHGRSPQWLALQKFLEDRLRLQCVEFNRESAAGISTQERLSELLGQAGFAFLVMTAEDEQGDGTRRARENVVHEAGLFQGRLTFRKAIVLLEEGCTQFSNIHGLGYIPFPTGRIESCFEEIRKVLEREKS